MMKRPTILFLFFLWFRANGQNYQFWVYPEFGYTHQKVNNWSAGIHLGMANKDSTGYLQGTYAFVLRGETVKYNTVSYLSPSFGFKGYNHLFGPHHGISYEIDFSYYHALQKTDWLATPEFGFAFGGWVNFMIGYSVNLDQRDLDFYTNMRFSLRLSL